MGDFPNLVFRVNADCNVLAAVTDLGDGADKVLKENGERSYSFRDTKEKYIHRSQ